MNILIGIYEKSKAIEISFSQRLKILLTKIISKIMFFCFYIRITKPLRLPVRKRNLKPVHLRDRIINLFYENKTTFIAVIGKFFDLCAD